MNILLIEDDIQLNTTIESFLQFKEYKVTPLFDGKKAIDYIDMLKYNLYIIDINLPHISGLDIVKYIRNKDIKTPIIMITASLEIDNLKVAYSNGCSEYIKKPFHLEELEIRINKLLSCTTAHTISISENIIYDIDYEELIVYKEKVKLRKKERRLLNLLVENINHTVSYETIENYVWENDIKEVYPLRQLVTELKKHFNKYAFLIETERGKGYKLIQEQN